MEPSSILLLEPFSCGSHKQLTDLLHAEFPESELFSLPGKKWHWKARTSALYFSQVVPRHHSYRTLFASSVLNLAELMALRPDLGKLWKVIYFHENQLVYPVRKQQERDFQYGYNQIISCLVADKVVFNSRYNMESFLSSINSFLKLIPDHRPKGILELIQPKCSVLPFPIVYSKHTLNSKNKSTDTGQEDGRNKADNIHKEDLAAMSFGDSLNSKTSVTGDVHEDTSEIHDGNCTDENIKMLQISNTEKSNTTDVHLMENKIESGLNESGCSQEKKPKNLEEWDKDLHTKCKKAGIPEISSTQDTGGSNNFATCDSSGNTEHDHTFGVTSFDLPGSGEGNERRSDCHFQQTDGQKPLHIVWPHRWEHDKGPDTFFKVLFQLHEAGVDFHLSVLGEQFTDVPEIFDEAKTRLSSKILHWGYQVTKETYFNILQQADCVVSTALHEFFGVAMLEAVYCGCYPLCPNRLVYPEIFESEYLYNTDNQLLKRLRELCRRPHLCRNHKIKVNCEKYSWKKLKGDYQDLLQPKVKSQYLKH